MDRYGGQPGYRQKGLKRDLWNTWQAGSIMQEEKEEKGRKVVCVSKLIVIGSGNAGLGFTD